jgi:hypothetical protein
MITAFTGFTAFSPYYSHTLWIVPLDTKNPVNPVNPVTTPNQHHKRVCSVFLVSCGWLGGSISLGEVFR